MPRDPLNYWKMAMASSSEEQRQNMSSASDNNDLDPVSDLLSKQGFVMLDGGLGTDLETLGYDISGISSLWSAYFLKNSPQVIAQVHRRFFDAGADVAITSSYQASFDGFKAEGRVSPFVFFSSFYFILYLSNCSY